MKINAIAIDDEPPSLKVIEVFCRDFDFIELQKTFTRTDEAQKYLRKYPVDLLFLDIQMPSLSGIELYKSIEQDTMVIFTTAFSEYAVEGFNLKALDYLLKPFTRERFAQAADKARDHFRHLKQTAGDDQDCLYLRADYSLKKIPFSDILYIEGLDDYIRIWMEGRKPLVARMTMKAVMEKLPARHFIRVHRSYIVPFRAIQQVRNKVISIGDMDITIGSSYEEAFFEKFRPE